MRTSISTLALGTLLMWCASSLAAAHPVSDDDSFPVAPAHDGRPGFGRRPELRAVEALFRSASGADAEFLAGLYDLATDVEVFLHLTAGHHQRRLYFVFVRGERGSLEDAYAGYDQALRTARTRAFDYRTSLALARIVHDERFAARRALLAAAREEVHELRSALALFVAHTHGVALIEDGNEVARIAGRANLAASRLRAVRLDLEALHEGWKAVSPYDEQDVKDLAQALRLEEPGAVDKLLRVRRKTADGAMRLREALFTTRFDRAERDALAERDKARLEAQASTRRLYVLLPETSAGQALPDDVAAMSRSERYREAVKLGNAALERDPFAAEINYLVALGVDFASGRKAASPYFDRFLALRGIRHYAGSTYDHGQLDAFERYAMFRVANWSATGPGGR